MTRSINSGDCVVAVYESFEKAAHGIHALEKADYPRELVSLVTHQASNEIKDPQAVQSGDRGEKDAAAGATAGGLLGLLVGTPLLVIPGLGPLLAAGPIATGIAGMVVGGFLGGMSGWGVDEDHIAKYQEYVQQGKLLVVAHGDPQQVAHAQRLLQETELDEIHHHASTSADDPNI